MTKFREGSQGAADNKMETGMAIAASIAAILVMFSYFVFDTDLRAFTQRAGFTANLVGLLGFIWSGISLWVTKNTDLSGYQKGGLWILGLIVGMTASAGFNFSYFGL
jgi:hypothetical protein